MAGKLSDTLGLRIQESTLKYYTNLSTKDKRRLVDYLRAVLEVVEEKGFTLQDLMSIPPK